MHEWGKEAERLVEDATPQRMGNVSKLALYELLGWSSYLVCL